MIIYGIKNCDKVRAAIKQVRTNEGVSTLHDFRIDGIDENLVNDMLKDIEFAQLLNKRSTTWKQLDQITKDNPTAGLLVKHPTLIKRPVIFENNQFRIGL